MADDYFSVIKSVDAVAGNVVLTITKDHHTHYNTITVNEAIDRAEAISGMLMEDEKRQGQSAELLKALMDAACEARVQQSAMEKSGSFVDFRMKEKNLRHLEVHRARNVG